MGWTEVSKTAQATLIVGVSYSGYCGAVALITVTLQAFAYGGCSHDGISIAYC